MVSRSESPNDDASDHPRMPLPSPCHRLLALGASNLKIGVSDAIESAQEALGEPLDVMAALGFGRSYGRQSWVLGRSLEGILSCGLWDEQKARAPLPTTALLTDVGNDILYDAPADQIGEWVEACLKRLNAVAERVIITSLPVENVEMLTPWRYLLMRTLLFPRCRLDLHTTIDRALKLNELVLEIAAHHRAEIVRPCPSWYGFDPIHVRRRYRKAAWRKFFFLKKFGEPNLRHPRFRFAQRLYLYTRRPLRRTLFGWRQNMPQPAGVLSNGTVISLY
jgi:hypothetical protein